MKWLVFVVAILLRLILFNSKASYYLPFIPIIWLLIITIEFIIRNIIIKRLNKKAPANFVTKLMNRIYDFSLEHKTISIASMIVLIPGATTCLIVVAVVLIVGYLAIIMPFTGNKSNTNKNNTNRNTNNDYKMKTEIKPNSANDNIKDLRYDGRELCIWRSWGEDYISMIDNKSVLGDATQICDKKGQRIKYQDFKNGKIKLLLNGKVVDINMRLNIYEAAPGNTWKLIGTK